MKAIIFIFDIFILAIDNNALVKVLKIWKLTYVGKSVDKLITE